MYKPTNLLVVEDDDSMVHVFERLSKDMGWTCIVAKSGEEALGLLSSRVFEAAVVDFKLPGFTGLQLLEHMKNNSIHTEIVIITGVGSVEMAVSAMKKGAYDYLTKPFDSIDRVAIVVEKAMERFRLVQKIKALEKKGLKEDIYVNLVGRSRKIQDVFNIVESIAPTTSAILIQGESGTGKELIAKAIHERSKRRDKPFIVINCAAIPVHLLESEIFGHRRGSFTGAVSDKRGLFEEADGGTIFLDEIAEVPPAIQVKLLRVLQGGEVRPVGDVSAKHVDVRLITATNQNLVAAVKEGRFREDLFYRINVIGIVLPPLRERADDIPLLAYHFLRKYGERMKKKVDRISIDALQALQNYSWVGNVRELENVIERAVVLCTTDCIEVHDLPAKILGEAFYMAEDSVDMDISQHPYREAKRRAMDSFNQAYIMSLLRKTAGNVSFASERADMDRSNFKKLIKRYKIDTDSYRKEEEK